MLIGLVELHDCSDIYKKNILLCTVTMFDTLNNISVLSIYEWTAIWNCVQKPVIISTLSQPVVGTVLVI